MKKLTVLENSSFVLTDANNKVMANIDTTDNDTEISTRVKSAIRDDLELDNNAEVKIMDYVTLTQGCLVNVIVSIDSEWTDFYLTRTANY